MIYYLLLTISATVSFCLNSTVYLCVQILTELFYKTRCCTIKVGTGFGNTIKGFVYAQSKALESCDSGFIALASNVLIRRPLTFDQDIEELRLCNILDQNNLEEVVTIKQTPEMDLKMVKL